MDIQPFQRHLLKQRIAFINWTKKLFQELWKNKIYKSPFISYSTCHRESKVCNSTPGYLHPVTSWVLNPLPLPTITAAQEAPQPLTLMLSIYSAALCSVMFFTALAISLPPPQEVLMQRGSDIKCACFVRKKKIDLGKLLCPLLSTPLSGCTPFHPAPLPSDKLYSCYNKC